MSAARTGRADLIPSGGSAPTGSAPTQRNSSAELPPQGDSAKPALQLEPHQVHLFLRLFSSSRPSNPERISRQAHVPLLLAIRVTTVFFVLSLFCAPLLLTVVDVERWPATEAWAAMGTGAAAGCWLTGTGGKRRYSHLEAGTDDSEGYCCNLPSSSCRSLQPKFPASFINPTVHLISPPPCPSLHQSDATHFVSCFLIKLNHELTEPGSMCCLRSTSKPRPIFLTMHSKPATRPRILPCFSPKQGRERERATGIIWGATTTHFLSSGQSRTLPYHITLKEKLISLSL